VALNAAVAPDGFAGDARGKVIAVAGRIQDPDPG
jgi:hypothetical protein